MSEQEINATIARETGWKDVWRTTDAASFVGTSPTNEFSKVPDYCTDLNAMHEVVCGLDLYPFWDYAEMLGKIVSTEYGVPSYLRASARQQAEAFLRTVGKWEGAAK